jgi:hypothetical protein
VGLSGKDRNITIDLSEQSNLPTVNKHLMLEAMRIGTNELIQEILREELHALPVNLSVPHSSANLDSGISNEKPTKKSAIKAATAGAGKRGMGRLYRPEWRDKTTSKLRNRQRVDRIQRFSQLHSQSLGRDAEHPLKFKPELDMELNKNSIKNVVRRSSSRQNRRRPDTATET